MDDAQAMIEAVKAGDLARVQELLCAQPGLADARTPGGDSAVLLAAYYGRHPIAAALVEAGASLSLYEAAAVGSLAAVSESLAGDGRLLDAYSHDGFTALGLAAFFGHQAIVDHLLGLGADVNAVSHNPMRVMALHSAVAGQHLAIAQALLEHGAHVNARQADGFTPLHGAAQNGQLSLVALLVEYGAELNVSNDDGQTALDLAREGGHQDVAQWLLDRGATGGHGAGGHETAGQ